MTDDLIERATQFLTDPGEEAWADVEFMCARAQDIVDDLLARVATLEAREQRVREVEDRLRGLALRSTNSARYAAYKVSADLLAEARGHCQPSALRGSAMTPDLARALRDEDECECGHDGHRHWTKAEGGGCKAWHCECVRSRFERQEQEG